MENIEQTKPTSKKATYYLSHDVIMKLNELQFKLYQQTGEKTPVSTLVSNALEDLFAKHGV